jgi:hypothetical protein
MNLVEFLFALATVFGSTAIITLWQFLMFKLDQEDSAQNEDPIRVVRIKNK